jgi:hypothetical protein
MPPWLPRDKKIVTNVRQLSNLTRSHDGVHADNYHPQRRLVHLQFNGENGEG